MAKGTKYKVTLVNPEVKISIWGEGASKQGRSISCSMGAELTPVEGQEIALGATDDESIKKFLAQMDEMMDKMYGQVIGAIDGARNNVSGLMTYEQGGKTAPDKAGLPPKELEEDWDE
mgnify:CR=1 FL=1